MDKFTTHYSNLQIAENASQEVIKGAYRYLQQKWHPDKNPGQRGRAEKITTIINRAYEVLSDPEKRREHDEWIAQRRKQAQADQWRDDLKARQREWERKHRERQADARRKDFSQVETGATIKHNITQSTLLSGLFAHSSDSRVYGFLSALFLCALSPAIFSIGVHGDDLTLVMLLLILMQCGLLAVLFFVDWLIVLKPYGEALNRAQVFWFSSVLAMLNIFVLYNASSPDGWEWMMLPGVLIWIASVFAFYTYARLPRDRTSPKNRKRHVSTLAVLWSIGFCIFIAVRAWLIVAGWLEH